MELSALAMPPPSAELLEQTEISRVFPVTAGDLTLTLEDRFTPDRVGSSDGTTAIALYGQLEPERQHPGGDYQCTELSSYIVMRRVRLGRYRWLLSNVMLEPPCVTITVDRVAATPKLVAPALATGDQCTFWLSTLGVDSLELENRANPQLPMYQDYVEVSVWSYEQNGPTQWAAFLRAQRVLAGYETASWERKLELGQADTCTVQLGDHNLELLEVVWVSDRAPNDVHARFRLSRGATADGMTR